MSVHDAAPDDVYVDAAGKLWRCVGICREPTVIFQEVEGHLRSDHPPTIVRDRAVGGVSGLMWHGWKRIWRREGA